MNLHNYFLLKQTYAHLNKQAGLESIGRFFGNLAGNVHNYDEKITEDARKRWQESGGLEGAIDRVGHAVAAPIKGVYKAVDAIDDKVVSPITKGFSSAYNSKVNPGKAVQPAETTPTAPVMANNSVNKFNTSIPGLAATAAGGVAGGIGGHYLANKMGLYDNTNPNGRLLGHLMTAGGAIGGAALGNYGANLVGKYW